MTPLVTVAILSYQRREAVTRVIASVLAQRYENLEVIVVDNGSEEDLVLSLRERFPEIMVVALPANLGAAARNRAIRLARGEIIVTLDNDVYFDRPDAVARIVAAFERRPKAGCVVFRIYHPATGRLHLRDWCHPKPPEFENEEFETHYLTEGAAAFRSEVFRRVEPYWSELFIGHEGFDLALRIMDAGYSLWYVPEVKVWHMASLATRQDWRPFYFNARNLFAIVGRDCPWAWGVVYMAPRLAVLGFYALAAHAFGRYLTGVADGVRMLLAARRFRRPVRPETLARIRFLKRSQAGLWARFRLARRRLMPLHPGVRGTEAG